ncbi:MAG: endolytic transglycosylase MltG [Spirochaetales bacterium]|nr:endolytic transglycosylase MltG [Spirochaetales bacterium]
MAENLPQRIFGRILLTLLVALPLVFFSAALVFWLGFNGSYGDSSVQENFQVSNGESFPVVARRLEESGLLKNAEYAILRYKIMRRLNLAGPLLAGRYSLSGGQKPSALIAGLTDPTQVQRVYISLTVPPGITAQGLAERAERAGLAYGEDVLSAVKKLASEYPIAKNPEGLQGYLFPETYAFESPMDEQSRKETANIIVRTLADQFFDTLDKIDPNWKELTPLRLHEKITLASIVEREYRVKEEASKIAAVFHNRIIEGMPLQSCATVAYVLENTEEGAPFLDEYLKKNRRMLERYLEIDSPYNTYLVEAAPALPPGPIAFPGRVALEAAFFPADSDALFFVVNDPAAGTHLFTRNYEDHLEGRSAYLQQYVVKD